MEWCSAGYLCSWGRTFLVLVYSDFHHYLSSFVYIVKLWLRKYNIKISTLFTNIESFLAAIMLKEIWQQFCMLSLL